MSTDRSAGELLIYLQVLAWGAKPGQFLDIRWAPPGGGMRRRFIPALRVPDAAALIRSLAAGTDVYVGVALRDGDKHGGTRAISGSHLLYVESDHHETRCRLEMLAHPPTLQIASGTPGHLHLYWQLRSRASSAEVERANRRLALRLGGDPASVDIARVLRAPETLNHKHDPPRPVSLVDYRHGARYALAELTAVLPDPRPPTPRSAVSVRRRRAWDALDREIRAIPAGRYVQVLVDRQPNGSGKIACPFHRDRNPSLQLYGDGSFYCFGCKRGGSIYDFASHLWGLTPRRDEFLRLRERLAARFHLETEPRP